MIKIVLPTTDIIKDIKEAKKYYLQVEGFFIKYEVTFNKLNMEIKPKEGFEYNPTDIFNLGFWVKDHMSYKGR